MNDHHAVLLQLPDVSTYEAETATPEMYVEVFREEKLGIEDVRRLIEKANLMPMNGATQQLLVVATPLITVEAQQALLKIVEEPPETTRFRFVVPIGMRLLPTLLSRFSVADVEIDNSATEEFAQFAEASIGERMTQIEVATREKDTTWQTAIKNGLVTHLKQNQGEYTAEQLTSLAYVASTLLTRGASNKFLLEELALTI